MPIEMITLNTRVKDRDLLAVAAGSVTVFVAPAGTGFVSGLKSAIAAGDEAFLRFLQPFVKQYLKSRPKGTVEGMARGMVRSSVMADVRAGGMAVAHGVFIPKGFKVVPIALPYNGGPLPARALELVEYAKDPAAPGLEAIAVKVDPVLTEAEKAALKLVPKDQQIRNLGGNFKCETTYFAVAMFAAVAGVTLATAAAAATLVMKVRDVHIDDELIRRLGPEASARKLVEMRREAMRKQA